MLKKLSLLSLILVIATIQSLGAYLKDVPQRLKQPDNSILNCLATGDEYYHWLHDENNFTIIKDPNTGYFVYASLSNSELHPTQLIPGRDDPAQAGLEPGLNIPASKVREYQKTKFPIPKLKGFTGTSNVGTLNNIVIFIRFNDQAEYTNQKSYYDNSFNGSNQVSMIEYFKEVSANQLTINTSFYPQTGGTTVVSFEDTLPRTYYQPYDASTNTNGYSGDTERRVREHTLLKYATESLTASIEATGLDFDMDNDGYIDNIAYIIQGATDGWAELLWPHMWALYEFDVRINGNRVWSYNFQLSDAFGVSVLCHEMFHSLGAPDLYRYNDKDITPVGAWDLMAWNRTPPQHMGAYMKMKYGKWFDNIPEITADGTYSLVPLSSNPFAAYKIASPNSGSEFFIVEYRKATGRFETSVPGTGLVVYRINSSNNGNANGPPDEVYVYRPDGTLTVDGSLSSAHFNAGTGRTEINDVSNPSSFLSDGSSGGLNISNIGSAGTTISFDVSFSVVGFNPPLNLIATPGTDFIDLSWNLPDAGGATLTGFSFFRNGQLLETIYDPTATTYTDPGLTPGIYLYYLTAHYSNPSGESGFSNAASAEIVEYLPDLIVQGLSLSQNIMDAGSQLTVDGMVVNDGNLLAGTSTLSFYLSSSSEITAGASELLSIAVSELAIGEQEDFSESFQIPSDLETGNYYIIVLSDSDSVIEETNETNNASFRMIGVRAAFADLSVTSLSAVPRLLSPGASVVIGASWSNIGNRESDIFTYSLVISSDREYDGTDILAVSDLSPVLAPGQQHSIQESYTVPLDLQSGEYYFVIVLDQHDEIPESNESNNDDYLSFQVSGYNIALQNLILNPEAIKDGQVLDVDLNVRNLGNLQVGSFDLHFAFSQNNTISPATVLKTINMSSLAGGANILISESLTIPEGSAEGMYFIQVYTDDDLIDDPDQSDNFIFRQISVFNLPDLQIEVSSSLNSYKPYEPLLLSLDLTNPETGDAIDFDVQVVLSVDQTADLEDLIIGEYQNLSLESKQSQNISLSYQFEENTQPGDYYVIGMVDVQNIIPESDESNNQAFWSFEVLDISSLDQTDLVNLWTMYPNPVSSSLHLNYMGTDHGDGLLSIHSMTGQLVMEQSLSLNKESGIELSLDYLPEGMYFIRILTANQNWQKRIVVID
ncbi:MAG: M6 family metalloprotease domain-containing protein [Bacteroidetes bacterium]|jgi:M6 family metalloprotease-like protein|nr:M6 family metalloprotease domain-containing protein [Bacteroidota bacterium]MBT4411917.1 M6 family metalloprotease domain-containing protein [Bacteroidota bacterium]MBT7463414.1 M6 family metalloprotease domain-containing protein [Bacteroidota bacterium]